MEHPISQRIKIIMDRECNGEVTKFAEKLEGVPYQVISRLFKSDKRSGKYPTPSTTLILEIINKFTSYSPGWLLTGEGKMSDKESISHQENELSVTKSKRNENNIHRNEPTDYWKDQYIEVQRKYTALLENKLSDIIQSISES